MNIPTTTQDWRRHVWLEAWKKGVDNKEMLDPTLSADVCLSLFDKRFSEKEEKVLCFICNGNGWLPDGKINTCKTCHGTGFIDKEKGE